jgi:hypothetical protein
MSGFVARLEEINGLADSSPGFVWRLQSSAGNATYLRPYENDRILLNMSVWETIACPHGQAVSSLLVNGRNVSDRNPSQSGVQAREFFKPIVPLAQKLRVSGAVDAIFQRVMDQRSLHSLARRFSSPMMNSRKASIMLLPNGALRVC